MASCSFSSLIGPRVLQIYRWQFLTTRQFWDYQQDKKTIKAILPCLPYTIYCKNHQENSELAGTDLHQVFSLLGHIMCMECVIRWIIARVLYTYCYGFGVSCFNIPIHWVFACIKRKTNIVFARWSFDTHEKLECYQFWFKHGWLLWSHALRIVFTNYTHLTFYFEHILWLKSVKCLKDFFADT